jgi:hypothetical protein
MENLLDIHGAREPLKNWSDNSSKFDDMVTGVSYNIKKRRNLKQWHKYVDTLYNCDKNNLKKYVYNNI